MQHQQVETSAADAVDQVVHGRAERKVRARGGERIQPEVKTSAEEGLTSQQRLQLIETELRDAQDQRKKLEDRASGVEARADAAERRLRAEVGRVAKELGELQARLEEEGDELRLHVRVLRAQVDDLTRRIARRPIRRAWDKGLSFSFLTL